MHQETQYLTKEKYKELQDELEQLRKVKRKEIAEHLEYAKKLGDLSENAEYHEAREEQAEVEDRINHLEYVLKTAQILNDRHGDIAGIGSTVKIQKEGDSDEKAYMIVGSEEADMMAGKISNLSPIGTALIGKKKGDKFQVKTPKGVASYTLISIE
ncbi:MAG: transcription elongation factor GreA [Patescibacteria group bacterium]